jgi:hypothetical protein
MKKSTTITYNIETYGGVSISELEYKDYNKNLEGEENLLHYKVKKINNITDNEKIKAIGDIDEIGELNETFNKICKLDNKIDETIGISSNNKEWKIHEYKNHKLEKEYKQDYETINFDINYDILQNRETKNYIKDNK